MAATLRELRGRIRSAGSIKKITKAQELIATSRICQGAGARSGSSAVLRRDHQHADRARGCQCAGPPAARRAGVAQARRCARRVLRPWALRGLQRQRAAAVRRALLAAARRGQDSRDLRGGSKGAGLLQLPSARGEGVVDRLLRAADLRAGPRDRRRPRLGLHGRRRRRGRGRGRRRHPGCRRNPHRLHAVQVDALAVGRSPCGSLRW